jgi:hypothetical protein
MGSNIEYRFDGSVTDPASVRAIVIPIADNQYAQIKVFAVCGATIGDTGEGGIQSYYLFCSARAAAGVCHIDTAVHDILTGDILTGIINIVPAGGVVSIYIYSPYGAGNAANWALRASVDFVDNVFYTAP